MRTKGTATRKHDATSDDAHILIYAIALTLAWTLVIGASLGWNIHKEHEKVSILAINEARSTFNKDLSILLWAINLGGVYVPLSQHEQPNPNLAHLPERDITTPSGKTLTLMSPDYMLRQMMDQYAMTYGVRGRITSEHTLSAKNAPDEWERKALEKFREKPEEIIEFIEIKGEPYLRLMQPMITQELCIKCHQMQGNRIGDIQGGLGITLPLSEYVDIEKPLIADLWKSHIIIWLLGVMGITFGYVRIKRMMHRREKAEQAREESERFLQRVLDGVAEPIMLIRNDYTVRLVNHLAMGDRDPSILERHIKCHEMSHGQDTPCDGDKHPCPLREVTKSLQPVTVVHNHRTEDGRDRYVEIIASPLFRDDGELEGIIETSRDITTRIIAEKHLIRSLSEKDMLIKEIHHRVKNNLLVIQSLLSLQSHKIKDAADKQMFAESESRVRAMSMIHERLYRSGDLSTINFPEYINSLAVQLFENYSLEYSRVALHVNIEDLALDIDTIIPCGLIVNELLSNALKYAFPGEKKGSIEVKMTGKDVCILSVEDNGIGLPEDLDVYNTTSLGMQIVTALTTQIGAELEISRTGGTAFRLTFNASGAANENSSNITPESEAETP